MDEERQVEEPKGPAGSEPERPPEPPGEREPEPPLVHPLTRVGLYMVVFLVLQVVVGIPAIMIWAVLSGAGPAALAAGEMPVSAILLVFVCLAPVMVPATLVFLRKLDRRPLSSMGVRWPEDGAAGLAREAGYGAAAALGLLGLWLAVAAVASEVDLRGISEGFRAGHGWLPGTGGGLVVLALYLAGFLVQGGLEEWVFRGYVYRALRERWNWPTVAGATSLGFAALHMANPGADPAGLLNTFLLGVVLAAAVEATGSLWPVMAAHGVWNFAMASVLGVPMSGVRVNGLLDLTLEGPAWVTGAAYGPEGSWLMTALLVPLVALLARWVDAGAVPADRSDPGAGLRN